MAAWPIIILIGKKINKIKGIFSILNKFVTFMSIFKNYISINICKNSNKN